MFFVCVIITDFYLNSSGERQISQGIPSLISLKNSYHDQDIEDTELRK